MTAARLIHDIGIMVLMAFVVIVAMWGIVGIVTKTFDLNGSANVTIPTVPINY